MSWKHAEVIGPRAYRCGYCGHNVAPDKGYIETHVGLFQIRICHQCNKPTFFDNQAQFPGVIYGNSVGHLPSKDVEAIYEEARRCVSVNAFTAAVLCCRKLLMHVAVEKGAPTGATFAKYVDHLQSGGLLPVGGKDWVDHIREKGNEANHEVVMATPEDAHLLLDFMEWLLKMTYELPGRAPKRAKTA